MLIQTCCVINIDWINLPRFQNSIVFNVNSALQPLFCVAHTTVFTYGIYQLFAKINIPSAVALVIHNWVKG